MSARKFKVGDRVAVVFGEYYACTKAGSLGKVVKSNDKFTTVSFDHVTGLETIPKLNTFEIYTKDLELDLTYNTPLRKALEEI